MKNEFMDLYNDIVKDEKKKKMPLTFNEFLEQTEEPKKNKKAKSKTIFLYYGIAASVVILLSVGLFWTNWTNSNPNMTESLVTNVQQESVQKPLRISLPDLEISTEPKTQQVKSIKKEVQIAKQIHKIPTQKKVVKPIQKEEKTEYIYINGKPIHNREEALDITFNTLDKVLVSLSRPKAETKKVERILKKL